MARLCPLLLTAALALLVSITLLAVALSSDHWLVLEVAEPGDTLALDLSSHAGLWRICRGPSNCVPLTDSLASADLDGSPWVHHLLLLLHAIQVTLLLSLAVLLCGWLWVLLSLRARSVPRLVFSGCYLLLGGVLTVVGAGIFISFAYLAWEELASHYGPALVQGFRSHFSWSLALAWVSCALEELSGALLLVAAGVLSRRRLQGGPHSVVF